LDSKASKLMGCPVSTATDQFQRYSNRSRRGELRRWDYTLTSDQKLTKFDVEAIYISAADRRSLYTQRAWNPLARTSVYPVL